ncbi:MAG TPA: hypothetical protein ENI02_02945 [Candidatus Aminicenantes bacterium]|nr:hypothetical protein [Candidatus Aminicenantes bacterium]
MESSKKQLLERVLKKLDFVNWDRYFGVGNDLTFFGWIDRKDGYKDFVVIDFIGKEISFATSSKEYSKKIADLLNVEHSDCERVEYFCDLPNVIKLKEKN